MTLINFISRAYRLIKGASDSSQILKGDPDWLEELKTRGLVTGKNFYCDGTVVIDSSHCWHITIGDNVTLAPNVHILAHDASMNHYLGYTKIGKVTIGNTVFIGASAIILPGVTIGDDVVIGAGSIVNIDIPNRCVASGNPVKVTGSTDDFIARKKEEMQLFPCFDESYTLIKAVSVEQKSEMNTKMKDRYGYIK